LTCQHHFSSFANLQAQRRYDALWQEDHRQHQDQPEDDGFPALESRQQFAGNTSEQRRTEDRAEHRRHAADDHHRHQFDRMEKAGKPRRDEADVMRL